MCDCASTSEGPVYNIKDAYEELSVSILQNWKEIMQCVKRQPGFRTEVGVLPFEVDNVMVYIDRMIEEKQQGHSEFVAYYTPVQETISIFLNHGLCV